MRALSWRFDCSRIGALVVPTWYDHERESRDNGVEDEGVEV